MKKTSLYLSEREDADLAGFAEREGRSRSDVIRAALAAYLEAGAQPDRDFAMLKANFVGDGRPVTQELIDELMQGFGEDRSDR